MGMGGGNSVEVVVESDGVDTFNGRMDSAIGSLSKFRTTVGLAGGALAALATGALAGATMAAADFEDAMVEVQKVTGPDTAEALRDEIKGLSEDIPLAQNELAGLAADAARFGVRGPDAILNFTESAAKMAEATDLAASQAGESLAKLAQLTGTPTSEMENLGSAINSLSNNFATSSSEVVEASLRSSAALSQLGLSNTEILGLNASLNEVSESSRRAGTRLRRVAQEVMNPKNVEDFAEALGMTPEAYEEMRDESPTELIVTMAEAMKEGGETADNLRRNMTTVSRQALAGLGQNLDGLNSALDNSASSFKENTSLQREFEAATATFNAKLSLLINNIRNVAIEIGSVLLPPLTRALGVLNRVMTSSDSLVNTLGKQRMAWGLVATAIGGAAVALLGLGGAPVAAALAGVLAVAEAWRRNFLQIRNRVRSAMRAVRNSIQTAIGIVKPAVMQSLTAMRQAWDRHGKQVVQNVTWALNTAQKTISDVLSFVLDGLIFPLLRRMVRLWNTHFKDIVNSALEAFNAVMGAVRKFRQMFIKNVWEPYGDEIKAVVQTAFNFINTYIGTILDAIMTAVNVFLDVLSGDWEGAWTNIREFVSRSLDRIISFVQSFAPEFLNFLRSAAKTAIDAAQRFISNLPDHMQTAVDGVIRTVSNFAPVFLSGLETAIQGGVDIASDLIGEIPGYVTDAIGAAVDYLLNDAPGDVTSALKTLGEAAIGTLELQMDIAGTIIGFVKDAADWILHNAVPWFADAMVNFGKGVANLLIGAINDAIPNSIGFRLPSIDTPDPLPDLGGNRVSASLPNNPVPTLAEGGVITSPTAAIMGEGREDEAVLPLSDLRGMLMTVAEAAREGGHGDGGGDTYHVTVEANNRREGRRAGSAFVDELRSAGFR